MLKSVKIFILIICVFISNHILASEKKIISFEKPRDIFRVREFTDTESSDAWKTDGEKSLKITFHKFKQGGEEWPAVIVKPKMPLSKTGKIKIDAFNPQNEEVKLNIHLLDLNGMKFSETFTLKGQSVNTLTVNMKKDFDSRNICEIHFYCERPENTYSVYLDNLRYIVDNKKITTELLNEWNAINKKIKAVPLDKLKKVSSDYKKDVQEFYALKNELQTIYDTKNESWESSLSSSEDLCKLENNLNNYKNLYGYLNIAAQASEKNNQEIILEPISSMEKIFIDKYLYNINRKPFKPFLQLARNEYESIQIAIIPAFSSLKNLKWDVSEFTDKNGNSLGRDLKLVGHVKTQQPAYEVAHVGWWPDPILENISSLEELPYTDIVTLWLTFKAAPNQPPGVYSGKITVSSDNTPASSIDINVKVWNFSIPTRSSLPTAIHYGNRGFRKLYGSAANNIIRKGQDWLLEKYRINPADIYYGLKDCNWTQDRLTELIDKGMNFVNVSFMNTHRPTSREFSYDKYSERVNKELNEIKKHMTLLEKSGAIKYAYMYVFDEYPVLELVCEAGKRFKEKFPDVKTLTTAIYTFDENALNLNTGLEGKKYIDFWCPLATKYFENLEKIKELKKQGERFWWYICNTSVMPYPTFFIESSGIDPRMQMGLMTAKYRPEGFLYYALSKGFEVTDKPFSDISPKTNIDPATHRTNAGVYNGDGSLVYPGEKGLLSSIRLENLRDGLEDYEYYILLEQVLKSKNMSMEELNIPQEVIVSLKNYTQNPDILYSERRRVAELILKYQ